MRVLCVPAYQSLAGNDVNRQGLVYVVKLMMHNRIVTGLDLRGTVCLALRSVNHAGISFKNRKSS